MRIIKMSLGDQIKVKIMEYQIEEQKDILNKKIRHNDANKEFVKKYDYDAMAKHLSNHEEYTIKDHIMYDEHLGYSVREKSKEQCENIKTEFEKKINDKSFILTCKENRYYY
jgi:hypothetical protein